MAILLYGSPPLVDVAALTASLQSSLAAKQLLNDNDANFTSTIGAWTASGGTMTRDTGSEKLSGQAADGKFAPAAPGDHADLPISGTFKANIPYVFAVVARCASAGASMDAYFGKIGTDSVSFTGVTIPTDQGLAFAFFWTPSADRTGVSFRWTNQGTGNVFILAARLYQTPDLPTIHVHKFHFTPIAIASTGFSNAVQMGMTSDGGVSMTYGTSRLQGGPWGGAMALVFDAGNGGASYLGMWAEHTPGDLVQNGGVNIETGVDYVGLNIMERDASTVQFAADWGRDAAAQYGAAPWQVSHNYGLVSTVFPTVPNGHFYQGYTGTPPYTSGGTEPVWPTNGTTVVDNLVTWTDMGLDLQSYFMQLRNRGLGFGWSISDDGTENGKITDSFQWTLYVAGVQTTGTDKAPYFQAPAKCRIEEVRCHLVTAPTGSSFLVDVNDDGTTIFTTQGNRPSIAASSNDDTSGTPDGGVAVAKDSVITVDVDQIGATIPGSDLVIFIRGRLIW